MSCGQIALNRIGLKPYKYYAAEVDKYAIKVTQANYPETIQMGDVTKWREWDIEWASIDLLIGGSPCQGFSFAGKQLAFDDPRSKLFFVYVDILNHIKVLNPSVKFMLENVKMKKEYLAIISEQLGVEPVFINSALVSAQNRQRYYWANWKIEHPEDKGILLKDITQPDIEDVNSQGWHKWWQTNKVKQLKKKYSAIVNDDSVDKAICMTARQYASWNGNFAIVQKARGLKTVERKTPTLSANSREHNNHLIKCINPQAGNRRTYQQDRVYKKEGKFPALTSSLGGRFYVEEEYLYRRLTPVECERLQTVPDNYTNHVSNTQRYKMLGNGWTVDVIAHIFSGIKQITPLAQSQ